MKADTAKRELVNRLQAGVNELQGLGKTGVKSTTDDFTPFAGAFPNGSFPSVALHEFISYAPGEAAATNGFITSLVGKFVPPKGICFWIGNNRKIFASGLKQFALEPDRIIFIEVSKPKDMLWVIEESLKCESIAAVVGELKELGFTESRRLQLAVEQSGVCCFIHRYQPRAENAVACTTRWKITPLPSVITDGLPGLGHSCWDVQLLKVRNGKPDSWQVSWFNGKFQPFAIAQKTIPIHKSQQAG